MSDRPVTVIDPVCGMTVKVAEADADGRIAEYDGRTYAFCRHGCRRAFLEEPAEFAAQAEAATAAAGSQHHLGAPHGHAQAPATDPATPAAAAVASTPVIDEGMRRWYESCSCCLSDAFPDIKAALDAERAAAQLPAVDAGICELAEADEAAVGTGASG